MRPGTGKPEKQHGQKLSRRQQTSVISALFCNITQRRVVIPIRSFVKNLSVPPSTVKKSKKKGFIYP
jgi:chemotaxis protein histidine kinase CheA